MSTYLLTEEATRFSELRRRLIEADPDIDETTLLDTLDDIASAANAVVDTVRNLTTPTPEGDWFSVGVCSDGSYGIEPGLIFSYPIRSNGKEWSVVRDLELDDFSKAKITATENELKEEKSMVADLLGK
jgi:malate dehydrogenase